MPHIIKEVKLVVKAVPAYNLCDGCICALPGGGCNTELTASFKAAGLPDCIDDCEGSSCGCIFNNVEA